MARWLHRQRRRSTLPAALLPYRIADAHGWLQALHQLAASPDAITDAQHELDTLLHQLHHANQAATDAEHA
ncbi:hypothetical protein [Mycobacterium malmoense]|uniref:hypothetical protein n=1 Tax=Mycobacterium malmoense TaxID=1780 RepID=UPI00114D4CEC|nr:hypothetical protein [Mycobacterium malmoense]